LEFDSGCHRKLNSAYDALSSINRLTILRPGQSELKKEDIAVLTLSVDSVAVVHLTYCYWAVTSKCFSVQRSDEKSHKSHHCFVGSCRSIVLYLFLNSRSCARGSVQTEGKKVWRVSNFLW
jgi:hypothetical protein